MNKDQVLNMPREIADKYGFDIEGVYTEICRECGVRKCIHQRMFHFFRLCGDVLEFGWVHDRDGPRCNKCGARSTECVVRLLCDRVCQGKATMKEVRVVLRAYDMSNEKIK